MLGGKLVILAGLFDKLKTDISGIAECPFQIMGRGIERYGVVS